MATRLKKTTINDEGDIIREGISEIELSRGDWVLVNYDNMTFPGEMVNIVANESEMNVTQKSGNIFRVPTPLHRKNRTKVSKKQAIYFPRKIRQICHYESVIVQEQL